MATEKFMSEKATNVPQAQNEAIEPNKLDKKTKKLQDRLKLEKELSPVSDHEHYLGYQYQLTYNSKFRYLSHKDSKLFILTNSLILGPSAIGYAIIWMTYP